MPRRHDQGTNKKTVENYGNSWLGTSHRRNGPSSLSAKGREIDKQQPKTWELEEVCRDDEPPAKVPDSSGTFALFALGVFALGVVKRRLKSWTC